MMATVITRFACDDNIEALVMVHNNGKQGLSIRQYRNIDP